MSGMDHSGQPMQPLVAGWLRKAELARQARQNWQDAASECMLFYAHSAQAMWDQNYQKKFYTGVRPPKFRININKAFELVALMLPNLFWQAPMRSVTPKRRLHIPDALYQFDEQAAQMQEYFQQRAAHDENVDQATSQLMVTYLNYTPREQYPDLSTASELCVVDALIKGRGVSVTRPFQFPGSDRILTGSFHLPPEDLLIDPDASSLADARWIAIVHRDPAWELARRFPVAEKELRERATIESHWHRGESIGRVDRFDREHGKTNDMVEWYEIFSKTGPGARLSGMADSLKTHLEESVGDFAYLAITPAFHAPLNCPYDLLKSKSTPEVVEHFRWPVEHWKDNDWPVDVLDFYPNTDEEDPSRAWPIPPLSPAMGELKLLNVLVPALVNRTWNSMRDFWAVIGPHVDHYKKYLESTDDQGIIPTPLSVDDVRKAITMIQQPQTNSDAWKILQIVDDMFQKRTAMNDFAYGMNTDGTQDRTAQTTVERSKATQVRPDFMRKKVAGWQSRLAAKEAYCAAKFVRGEHVKPLLGEAGAFFWDKYVAGIDDEALLRQFNYEIGSASMERPNRERNLANFQVAMQYFLATVQQYGASTGDYQPYNAIVEKFGELHDERMDALHIPPPDPEQAQREQQMQEQQMELQRAETEAKLITAQANVAKAQAATEKAQIDAQAKMLDSQSRAAESQLQQSEAIQRLTLEQEAHRQELIQTAEAHQQAIQQDRTKNILDLLHESQDHRQGIRHAEEKHDQGVRHAEEMAKAKKKAAAQAKPKPSPSQKAKP